MDYLKKLDFVDKWLMVKLKVRIRCKSVLMITPVRINILFPNIIVRDDV